VTTIRFQLPREEHVTLEVFDAQGRRVGTLADGSYPAGYHAVDWRRTESRGGPVQPGIYVYRIRAGTFQDQKKLVLLP
jgi:flagellar hook assembly protein FlgD